MSKLVGAGMPVTLWVCMYLDLNAVVKVICYSGNHYHFLHIVNVPAMTTM